MELSMDSYLVREVDGRALPLHLLLLIHGCGGIYTSSHSPSIPTQNTHPLALRGHCPKDHHQQYQTNHFFEMDESARQHKTHTTPDEQGPRYKGIRLRKWGRWVSEVRMPKSRAKIWLGSYDTAEQAARAYDAAVFCLRGTKASLNFPGCIPLVSCASSLSHKQIQVTAAKYALHQIPSNPNPNSKSNSVLTEEEPQSPSVSSSVSQTEPSSDDIVRWEWPGEEQETNLWEPFLWDSAFMDLEKTSEISMQEDGCLVFDTTDIWGWS